MLYTWWGLQSISVYLIGRVYLIYIYIIEVVVCTSYLIGDSSTVIFKKNYDLFCQFCRKFAESTREVCLQVATAKNLKTRKWRIRTRWSETGHS